MVSVKLQFGPLRQELAAELEQSYADCDSADLVVGFMTVEGVDALLGRLRGAPSKLNSLVVGAATWRAFDAFDQLLAAGVPSDRLLVHLGHSRPQSAAARYSFARYHPMLHSKVYLFEMPGRVSVAYVGSHNLTGFALNGLNGEASVRLEGATNEPVFQDLRAHVLSAVAEAVVYDPAQRDAYAWWSLQFTEGLKDKFNDMPRDAETVRTIVLLAEGDEPPHENDTIYFELPEGLGRIQSLKAEVHLFLFRTLPPSSSAALAQLHRAEHSTWCRTVGIEDDRGGRELRADWFLDGPIPRLRRAPRPFRPAPGRGMQQVRVQAYKEVRGKFDYLFDDGRAKFEPIFDQQSEISPPPQRVEALRELNLVPPEDRPWVKVQGLRRSGAPEETPYTTALRSLSPESGSYILMSLRRRNR